MDDISKLLTRGVDTIYPSREELENVLRSGKKLKLYQGFDPTGTQLHIGHMIGLKKLAQWADLGHEVIFLIGDGTGQAGDPSGKLSTRDKFFTREELRENAKEYVMQAKKIIDFDKPNVKILYNGDWLNSLGLVEILNILDKFSHQQLIERDMFQERIKNGERISMREFIYPILPGYASVAMDVDLELGGTDQMFNMMCGRVLQKGFHDKEKFVMTTPLLEDSQGRKIGKTEGNVIGLTDNPSDLYGKIMSLSDDVIVKGLEYLTNISLDEIKEIKKKLEAGKNPIEFKKKLAYEIVKDLNSEDDAEKAQGEFEKVVQNKETPEDLQIYSAEHVKTLDEVLVDSQIVSSKSEVKRLAEQGGIEIDGKKISVDQLKQEVSDGSVVKIGKHKFLKIEKT